MYCPFNKKDEYVEYLHTFLASRLWYIIIVSLVRLSMSIRHFKCITLILRTLTQFDPLGQHLLTSSLEDEIIWVPNFFIFHCNDIWKKCFQHHFLTPSSVENHATVYFVLCLCLLSIPLPSLCFLIIFLFFSCYILNYLLILHHLIHLSCYTLIDIGCCPCLLHNCYPRTFFYSCWHMKYN